ncbi:hypothetical protein QYF36_004546 [Acer negundo]|nr:hypothetical protein QYF36_004546 [Acer negundo]
MITGSKLLFLIFHSIASKGCCYQVFYGSVLAGKEESELLVLEQAYRVPRNANAVACGLAKMSSVLIEDTVWLEDDMIMFVVDVIVICFLE